MANVSANVRVGVTGSVYQADAATALPADATTVPAVDYTDLGYVSQDGVSVTTDRSTETIKAWGGDTVRVIQTEHDVTVTFTLIETKAEVLATFYNDATASATLVSITGDQAVRNAYVIDVIDGTSIIRLSIPDAEVTDTSDITYATAEAIGYTVTLTCYPDGTGVKIYQRMSL